MRTLVEREPVSLAVPVLGTLALAMLSCSAPSKGAVVLDISTDMQTPKDVNVVSVFVSTNSVPKFDYLGRVTPEGKVILPATLAVVEADDANAEVRVRVTAFREAEAKVLRDVITTVPHARTALLRLPLDFVDVGSVTGSLPSKFLPDERTVLDGFTTWDPTGPSDLVATCDFHKGLTMVDGQCVSAKVDPQTLPDYDATLVFGEAGLQPSGTPGSCFDVARCFQVAGPAVGLDPAVCTFPLPQGADPAMLNVAVVTGTTGACLPVGGCFVPLEKDGAAGFTVSGGTVKLAPAVCAKFLSAGAPLGPASIYVSEGGCAAFGSEDVVCQGAGSDAGPTDANAAPDSGIDATLDAGADGTMTGDAPAVSTCDAGLTACGTGCVDLATDPANCGGCGAACSGTCAFGRCAVDLLAENQGPYGVTHDATNIYWTDFYADAVLQRPIAGGSVVTLGSGSSPAYIAVDGSSVYWTDGVVAGQYRVMSAPIGGGLGVTIAQSQGAIGGLTVGPSGVYWTTVATPCPADGAACPGLVMKAPLDGGAPITLATVPGTLGAIAVGPSGAYATATNGSSGAVVSVPLGGGSPTTLASGLAATLGGITVGGTNVYFGSFAGNGTVSYVSIDGGAPTTLATATPGNPMAIAVDSTNVYWGTAGGFFSDGVFKAPLVGGTTTTLVSTGLQNVESLTVDSTTVYWTDFGGANLDSVPIGGGLATTLVAGASGMRGLAFDTTNVYVTFASGVVAAVPIAGGAPTTLASGQAQPHGVAVDTANVYWTNEVNGAVVKAPLGGGAPTTIATGQADPYDIAVSGATAFWTASSEGPVYAAPVDGSMPMGYILAVAGAPSRNITLDPANAYWSSVGGSWEVSFAPLDASFGNGMTMASSPGTITGVAVGPTNLYWTNAPGDAGAVFSVPLGATADAGPAPTVLAGGNNPLGIAVDSTSIYWTDQGLQAVLKMPLQGGTPTTLASTPNPSQIAVDGTNVYWIDSGSHLRKVPK